METVCLLDTETTSLSPSDGRVIEVAACLYDLTLGSPIESYASLIRHQGPNPAKEINRISEESLVDAPQAAGVWMRVAELAEGADCLCAHRAEFDRGFVESSIQHVHNAGDTIRWPEIPWVCSKTDVAWPTAKSGEHLVHLALHYGLGVAHAHRAMSDVDTLCRILTRVHELGHSLPELFKRAARPKRLFVALVSYDQRSYAKDAGFTWNDLVPQAWARKMPPEDAAALPFRVQERPL